MQKYIRKHLAFDDIPREELTAIHIDKEAHRRALVLVKKHPDYHKELLAVGCNYEQMVRALQSDASEAEIAHLFMVTKMCGKDIPDLCNSFYLQEYADLMNEFGQQIIENAKRKHGRKPNPRKGPHKKKNQ